MRKQTVRYAGLVIALVSVAAIASTAIARWSEWRFAVVFNQAVEDITLDGTMAAAGDAEAAADACETVESRLAMERRCLKAFDEGSRVEQLVAAHVLFSRHRVAPSTVEQLDKAVNKWPGTAVQHEELISLRALFDVSGRRVRKGHGYHRELFEVGP